MFLLFFSLQVVMLLVLYSIQVYDAFKLNFVYDSGYKSKFIIFVNEVNK